METQLLSRTGKPLIRVEMIRSDERVDSYATMNGKRFNYVRYLYPPEITRAIGMGASGGSLDTFAHKPTPALLCEPLDEAKYPGVLIAVAYA